MKIALISLSTPTFNNVRAASALPYHLISGAKHYNLKCQFEVYSFNLNNIDAKGIAETERALGVKVRLLPRPKFLKWMFRLHLVFLRVLLRYPLYAYLKLPAAVAGEINQKDFDRIWIYGEELAGLARVFHEDKCIVTMPDCESMYYHRLLAKQFAADSALKILRYAFAYSQYRRMEHDFFSPEAVYHFVGAADAEFFEGVNKGAKAVFLRHPLYFHKGHEIKFHQPKVRLLFAGRYDFYSSHGSDELLEAMIEEPTLKANFEITFLGKGWDEWNRRLRESGWTASHITFAPNYVEELQRHDIQVNAIDVGTGTKGKVLDAISNGLLALGTPYALENICTQSGKGCLVYNNPQEAVEILKDIPGNLQKYEDIARKGTMQVIAEHNALLIASQLFGQE